jgi:hypothetical protein
MNIQAREEFHYLFSIPNQAQPSSWFSAFRTLVSRFAITNCCSVTTADSEAYLKTAGALVGFSNINTLALPFLLKDTYHLSPAGLGLMGAVIAAPVFLKPGIAMLQGSKPRKPFLVLAACGDLVARVGVGLLPADGSHLYALGGLLMLGSASLAVDAITRDTLLIETMNRGQDAVTPVRSGIGIGVGGHPSAEGDLIADVAGLASLTALSVAYFSGYLLQYMTPAHLILASSSIPLLSVLNAARFVESAEQPTSDAAATSATSSAAIAATTTPAPGKIEQMWRLFRSSPVLMSQLSASSISAVAPTFQDAIFYYYTDELQLTPEFFGRWRLVGNLASLLANGLYRGVFKDVDQKTLAIVSQSLLIPIIGGAWFITTGSTERFFGADPATFVLVRHALFDGINTLAAIPNTVMLARVAPRGREGLFFAVYGLINDCTNVLNGAVSSATTMAFGIRKGHFDNITNLVLFSSTLQVLVAPWTVWTPESVPALAPEDEREVEEENLSSSSSVLHIS